MSTRMDRYDHLRTAAGIESVFDDIPHNGTLIGKLLSKPVALIIIGIYAVPFIRQMRMRNLLRKVDSTKQQNQMQILRIIQNKIGPTQHNTMQGKQKRYKLITTVITQWKSKQESKPIFITIDDQQYQFDIPNLCNFIKEQVGLSKGQTLLIFMKGHMRCFSNQSIYILHRDYKSQDGILYLQYAKMETFG